MTDDVGIAGRGRGRRWRSPHRWVGAALAATAMLVLAACSSGSSKGNGGATGSTTVPAQSSSTTEGASTSSTAPSGTTTTAPGQSQVSSCTLPLTHDTFNGFHIAVPANWELSTLNGQVEVQPSSSSSEGVLVYPALQTQGLSPATFFSSYLASLERRAKGQGLTLNATMEPDQHGLPVASLAEAGGVTQLVGKASLAVLPLRTQLSSSELVLRAYFAPASTFATNSAMLSSIANCYGPESSTLFRVFQDQVFTYIMPPRWNVFDEGQNGIDIHGPAGEDVSYTLLEAVAAAQADSPQTMINFYLAKLNVQSVVSLWSTSTPGQPTASGGIGALGYEEFTANLNGPVHGLIYANVTTGGGVTSGVVRLALSTASEWNAENSGLIQMAGAIQHNFTQDLQQLQQVNQQFQDFSGQVANFDDTLNSQQLVQDPATGTYYEAPYSSYQVNGPDGPGYYNGNTLLNPVQRS